MRGKPGRCERSAAQSPGQFHSAWRHIGPNRATVTDGAPVSGSGARAQERAAFHFAEWRDHSCLKSPKRPIRRHDSHLFADQTAEKVGALKSDTTTLCDLVFVHVGVA